MKFSVVTITYNAAPVLQRTLDSVRSQTYRDVEHLIIDGASTDDTLRMAEEYKGSAEVQEFRSSDISSKDPIFALDHTSELLNSCTPKPQIKVISEPDKGIYDAMNKGLRLATGDYIVFMNAGDTFHDEKTLERVAIALTKPPLSGKFGGAYGDTDIVDAEGLFLRKRHLSVPEHLTWRSFKQGMLVCHQAFYARLDIARDIPYDLQYHHSADVDWCIRVMKEAERKHLPLVRVPGVIADFMDGGNTTQNHRASLKERFTVMRHHYGLLTTLTMHVWFVLRAILSKFSSR